MRTGSITRSGKRPGRKRPWPSLLLAAAVLAALALAAPLAATFLVGEPELRETARQALASALGRPVEITGPVSLSLFPRPGLRAGGVAVLDPGGGEPFLSADSLSVGIKPLALLGRRIAVDTLSLSGASLRLTRDAQGRGNWLAPAEKAAVADGAAREPSRPDAVASDPVTPDTSKGGAPMADPAPSSTAPALALPGWTVEPLPAGMEMKDARLSLSDARSGLAVEVRSLALRTSSSSPFTFSLSCAVSASLGGGPGLRGELHAEGLGRQRQGGVLVERSRAAGTLDLPHAPGRPGGRVSFSADVAANTGEGAFEAAGLVLEGLGARITGQVNAAGLFDETPYIHLDLAARGSPDGPWAALAGLAARRGGETAVPAIRAPQGDVEAELLFASTPKGWMVRKALLRDAAGSVSGTARHAEEELEFDVQAHGFDLGRWLPALSEALAPGGGPLPGLVRGRFAGRDVRLGALTLGRVDVNASGRGGQVRLYPFTATAGQAHAALDIKLSGGDSRAFSGTARLTALDPGHPPASLARAEVSGVMGPFGLSGALEAQAFELRKGFAPAWLPDRALSAWAVLGGGSLSCAFALPPDGRGWRLSSIDARTSAGRLAGSLEQSGGKMAADLQADALDMDRLRPLAPAPGDGAAQFAPVEGRLQARRLTLGGVAVDDVALAFEATPGRLRLGQASGAALGGRFSGSLEYGGEYAGEPARAGRRSLSAAFTVSGVQAAQALALKAGLPRVEGALEGRVSLEASAHGREPLWHALHAQADLQLGKGSVSFAHGAGAGRPWPVGKAAANLKATLRKAPGQAGSGSQGAAPGGGQAKPEAALADIAGSLRVESPGVVRSTRVELKGQAGLDGSGGLLWYRQPRLEGEHALALPFAGPSVAASWSGRLEADFEKEAFSLPALDVSVAGVPGRASLTGKAGREATELSGSLDIPEFSPRAAAPRLGFSIPAGADPNMWRRARLATQIGGSLKEIRLERLNASLDDASATGQAVITPSAGRLDLSVTTLDLDRLCPAPIHPDPARRPEEALPLAQLRELSLEARVRLGWLKKDRLVYQNSQAEFSAHDGRFHLRQHAPDFYGGPYTLDLRGDARGPELKARMELSLKNFHPGPLLRDLAGADSISGGRGEFWLAVDTHGATDRQLRRKATGQAGFEVRGGVLGILQSPKQPAPPVSLTGGREEQPPPAPAEGLPISRLGASFTVREGWAVTRDFVLAGKNLSARGDGWVTLDDERIDLSLTASVPDVGEVPVRINGPLYDPKFDIDKSKLIGETVMNIFKGVFTIPGSILMQLRRVF